MAITCGEPPITVSKWGANRTPSMPSTLCHAQPEEQRLHRSVRCPGAVALSNSPCHNGRGADAQPHRHRIDDREHRLGESHRSDRLGAESRHEEDVGHGKDALERDLEHHRHGEQQDRAADGAFGVVLMRSAQRLANSLSQLRAAPIAAGVASLISGITVSVFADGGAEDSGGEGSGEGVCEMQLSVCSREAGRTSSQEITTNEP